MSRGIGKRQLSMLQALVSLDAEAPDHYFPMSRIITRLYSISPDLQAREQREQERRAARKAKLEAEDALGDERAGMLLMLEESIMSYRNHGAGRKRERELSGQRSGQVIPRSIEGDINPSRCIRALVDRGLAEAHTQQGWFGLTPPGRDKCRNNSGRMLREGRILFLLA
jgi:hypothetical protein